MIVAGRDRTFNTKYDPQRPMKNLADITVILDRSGSMSAVADATINGFNEFVMKQRNTDGNATLSLIQFDDQYETVYEQSDLSSVKLLNEDTFVPRGMTALNDAIAKTITGIGERLAALPEYKRPDKVIVVIITDGFENASLFFSQERVAEMIKHQKDKYSWEFLFLGANQDAVLSGAKYGIAKERSLSYASSKLGTTNVYAAVGASVANLRTNNVADFTEADRVAAMESDSE
jgi:uncharacterized protein YegL